MAVSLDTLRKTKRSLTIDFFGTDITFSYNPALLTPAYYDWQREHGREDGSIYGMLQRLEISWEICDTEGRIIPATEEAFKEAELPLTLLHAIKDAVRADFPKLKTSTTTLPI